LLRQIVRWRVGAGEMLDVLVARSVEAGLAGLECLSGIPGCVGATPIQNVGAYGQDVSETIVHVNTVDRVTGELRIFDNAGCGFGYRNSVFKEALAGRHVVLEVTFALRARGAPLLRYAELQRHFGGRTPSLAEVRDAVIAIRRSKSMIIAPDDPNRQSAGSFFVNPTVSVDHADDVERRAGASSGTMPRFAAGDGRIKLSAAWLIERAGFSKGDGDGPVGISTRHALSIVNRGGATASQIVAFAAKIRAKVYGAFAVALSPEPSLVGFDEGEIRALVG
jgi:UDP-N-acetylmuramate dehydrogenase